MIPHCRPFLAPNQKRYVLDAMRRGDLMRGAYVDRLEAAMSEFCGGHAVAVSSGTAGLVLAVRGRSPGTLCMPALTYVAPAQAMLLRSRKPLFVDIDASTWGSSHDVDVQVHLYGAVADGWAPVEDACEALGAWQLSGGVGVVSFNQNKIATGGGGGAVLYRDKSEADATRHAIRGGRVPGAAHLWDVIGWPFEMSNLQAAVACAQLDVLKETIERKQAIAARYRAALPEIAWHESVTYWQPCGLLPVPAAPVVTFCQANGVEARHVWPCLADLPLFKDCPTDGNLPVARRVARHGISLPCSVELTPNQQAHVIATVRRALGSEHL